MPDLQHTQWPLSQKLEVQVQVRGGSHDMGVNRKDRRSSAITSARSSARPGVLMHAPPHPHAAVHMRSDR